MSERFHDPEGGQCCPEICGGVSYDPCNYTRDDVRKWTRSVYVIGGAGSGKSTFTAELLTELGYHWTGPLKDLHSAPNARGTVVTLRGHEMRGEEQSVLYLGVMRDEFPGTDGLDRASSFVGTEWLHREYGDLPDVIIAEGATLASRPFLTALHETTDLLLVHLYVDPVVADLRFLQRGSSQPDSFVKNTVTRSVNLLRDMAKLGVDCATVDTANLKHWRSAIDGCKEHLQKG